MKTINLKLIIVLVAISFNYSNVYAQKTEYYRHLVFRETPYSDLRGIHPIDKTTAVNETHFRFVYDNQNRFVDAKGELVMPEGAPYAAIEFKYAEDSSMTGRTFYDANMKEVER